VNGTIILVGVPDTGKTNYLARLWEALRGGLGSLVCPTPPDNIKYVEDALGHVLQGSFAPRSNKNIGESRSDVRITVVTEDGNENTETNLLIPDVTGELWKKAVETLEIPDQWMSDLQAASGAMLFVRVLSDQIVAPLDWITARGILRGVLSLPRDQNGAPTQVVLCELLRFLELSLKPHPDGSMPRIALVVTAYDLLDPAMAARGPSQYLEQEFPLFAGRLRDAAGLSIRAFGASIVGGDLTIDEAFRNEFLGGDISRSGFVVVEQEAAIIKIPDITAPLAWLVQGERWGR
jgi:hypothetical protein